MSQGRSSKRLRIASVHPGAAALVVACALSLPLLWILGSQPAPPAADPRLPGEGVKSESAPRASSRVESRAPVPVARSVPPPPAQVREVRRKVAELRRLPDVKLRRLAQSRADRLSRASALSILWERAGQRPWVEQLAQRSSDPLVLAKVRALRSRRAR